MAISEYVLLVSLSAGIHAHADTGISIGPDAVTQPNGGALVARTHVADKHKDIGRVSTSARSLSPATQSTKVPGMQSVRPPAIRTPSIKVK